VPKDNKEPKKASAPSKKAKAAVPTPTTPPPPFVEPKVPAQPEHLCPKCQKPCKTLTMRVTMCGRFAPKL
jgi:hypothetical protein